MEQFMELLQYDFVQRALLAGSLLSVVAALLGSCLISKRLALLAYCLANLAFLAVASAQLLRVEALLCSLAVVLPAAVYFLQREERGRIPNDSLLALAANVALALGITLIAYVRGMTLDICNFMFGSVLVLRKFEVYLMLVLLCVILLLFVVWRKHIFAWQADRNFYRLSGLMLPGIGIALACMTGTVVAVGIRFMGTLLIASLLILPALSAMNFAKTYRRMQIYSVLFALFSFYAGIYCSYRWALPSGATIVSVNALCFLGGKAWIFCMKRFDVLKKGLRVVPVLFMLSAVVALVACAQAEGEARLFAVDTLEEQGDSEFRRELGVNKGLPGSGDEALPSGQAPDGSTYFPIYERNFVLLSNEIYANYQDYLNKTVAYEGFLVARYDEPTASMRYFIIRRGPGCCAYDSMPGFEVILPPDYAYVESAAVFADLRTSSSELAGDSVGQGGKLRENIEQVRTFVPDIKSLVENASQAASPKAVSAVAGVYDASTASSVASSAAPSSAVAKEQPTLLTDKYVLLENEWLYCEGKLETYSYEGSNYLRLRLTSLEQGRAVKNVYVKH